MVQRVEIDGSDAFIATIVKALRLKQQCDAQVQDCINQIERIKEDVSPNARIAYVTLLDRPPVVMFASSSIWYQLDTVLSLLIHEGCHIKLERSGKLPLTKKNYVLIEAICTSMQFRGQFQVHPTRTVFEYYERLRPFGIELLQKGDLSFERRQAEKIFRYGKNGVTLR